MKEAEAVAEKFLQEEMTLAKDAQNGNLTDPDLDQVSLRDKVFQVCSMLYEQQKIAGYQLAILESQVSDIRQDFTHVILRKNTWET